LFGNDSDCGASITQKARLTILNLKLPVVSNKWQCGASASGIIWGLNSMTKSLGRNHAAIGLLAAGLLAGGGYYFYISQLQGIAANYTDSNINFGAIDTAAADAACTAAAGHEKLVCLTGGLKKLVTPELAAKFELAYSVEDARKWSNFPPVGYRDRVGPTLGEFTLEQLGYIKTILKTAASDLANEGVDELEQILNADDYLKVKADDGAGFSSSNYHFALLGKPATAGTWQLYFGGHHFAFANTYTDGKLTGASPSFRGVEPFTKFSQNGRDNEPMAQEQAAFAAMLKSLSTEEAAKAKLAQTYTNIIAGPQQDNAFPSTREGIRAGDLPSEKQALVLAAIETYVRDIATTDADAIMARYTGELAETFLAFSGTAGVNAENDYIRIDGPSVWIEFSMQPGRSIPGMHPHSVWRDRTSDYGGNS
jgi:Protein of unknown function (DUF3500)